MPINSLSAEMRQYVFSHVAIVLHPTEQPPRRAQLTRRVHVLTNDDSRRLLWQWAERGTSVRIVAETVAFG